MKPTAPAAKHRPQRIDLRKQRTRLQNPLADAQKKIKSQQKTVRFVSTAVPRHRRGGTHYCIIGIIRQAGGGGLGSPSGGRGGTPHLNNGAVQVAGFWPGAKCLAENPSQMAKSVTLATFFGKKLSKKAEYFPPVLSYFFKILDGVREVREGWVKVPSSHLCTHVHPYMASIRLFLRVYVDASS